jgi:large subunit ribosomal protein L7/L12
MADLQALSEELSKLSVLEASELVTLLEDKWGVKAASGGGMMMMAGGAAAGAAPEAEKDEFDVELTSVGDKKIQVIKVVREVTGLGLKEAKEMVDNAPKVIKEALSKADADVVKEKLEAQGAGVTLK